MKVLAFFTRKSKKKTKHTHTHSSQPLRPKSPSYPPLFKPLFILQDQLQIHFDAISVLPASISALEGAISGTKWCILWSSANGYHDKHCQEQEELNEQEKELRGLKAQDRAHRLDIVLLVASAATGNGLPMEIVDMIGAFIEV